MKCGDYVVIGGAGNCEVLQFIRWWPDNAGKGDFHNARINLTFGYGHQEVYSCHGSDMVSAEETCVILKKRRQNDK